MIAKIFIREGKNAGADYVIREGQRLTFGRSETSDVPLLDGGVSRIHCMVENKGGAILLSDLGSSNGTFVNNEKQANAQLQNRDQIRIGYALLEVEFDVARKQTTEIDIKELRTSKPALIPVPGDGTKVLSEKVASTTMRFMSEGEERKGGEEIIKKKVDIDKASLMTAAVDKKAKDKDLIKAYENLTTIYKVGNIINSMTDVNQLFQTVLETILEVIKADRGALLLYDEQSGETTPVAAMSNKETATEGDVKVSRTVVDEVVRSAVSILSSDAMTDERFKSGQSIILQEIKSVMCAPLMTSERVIGALYVDSSSVANFFNESDLDLLAAIGKQAGIAIHNTKLRNELKESHLETIFRLAVAAEYKDQDTAAHIHRISGYSETIARQMGLSDPEITLIRYASPMHDVGKLGIADAILLKPGRLTPEERAIMEQHTIIGSKILQDPHSELMQTSHDIALTHHEKWDGSGYPKGLKGEEIPLFGRIVALVDVFDALISKRCYKEAFEVEKAVGIIREERGKHFDPACVDAFFDCFDEILAILEQYKEG